VRLDDGYHTAAERRAAVRPPRGFVDRKARRAWLAWYAQASGKEYCCPERMGRRERAATPLPFRDLLLAIARSATPVLRSPGERGAHALVRIEAHGVWLVEPKGA